MFDFPIMSIFITVLVCLVFGFFALCALGLGLIRWIGIQCERWPIGGPLFCGLSMAFAGVAAMRINLLVATCLWLAALGLLGLVIREIVKTWKEPVYAVAPAKRNRNRMMPSAPVPQQARSKLKQ